MSLTFTPVSREDLPKVATRSNSASAGMFKDFLDGTEAGDIVQVNVPEDGKSNESIRSTLQNYITRHDLSIKLFSRGGNLYMEHLSAEDYEAHKAEQAEKSARRKPRTPKADANGAAETVSEGTVEGTASYDEG